LAGAPADWSSTHPANGPRLAVVGDGTVGRRRIEVTPASRIKIKAVRWLWDQRLASGSLALLAGREGLGKSSIAYWIVAQVTRGRLPGQSLGEARAVLIAATEDDWEHTIVPRLMAAGADLDLVYRLEVITSEETHASLTLPADNAEVEAIIRETGAALVLLDPLMSRIEGTLDTHKDGDVRRALEPIVSIAQRAGCVVLGLIHLNKGAHGDLLTAVMGSRAFSAVARTVLACIPSPEDDGTRLFGIAKSNLGRTDLPSRAYRIATRSLGEDEDGFLITTAAVDWLGDVDLGIDEAMSAGGSDSGERAAGTEAARWLADYMEMHGPRVPSKDVKAAAAKEGITTSALQRARQRLKLGTAYSGMPATTVWISAEEAARERSVQVAVPNACGRCGGRLDPTITSGYHVGCEED
jgi:hypothetical protein